MHLGDENMNIENKKYYTCKYDRPFKEIMLKESNKDILKKLLEHILKEEIKEITILPTERNNRNLKIKRKTLDVLLKTEDKQIGIELNANIEDYVHPRNMAYIADMYASHILVGQEYTEEILILQINLTYGLGLKDKKGIRRYHIQDKEGNKFVKNLEIIEVNMDSYMDLWYNKNEKGIEENKILVMLGLEKEDLKILSKNDKVVSKYMDELNKLNESTMFRRYMTEEEDMRIIQNTRMKSAEKKGIEKGLEQGIKDGKAEEKISIAKNLLDLNMSINDISKATGLSVEQIENLK